MIANYYQQVRGIPAENILGLSLPRKPISVGDWSDPHIVKLEYNNENIQDSTWAAWDNTHCVDTAKFHAWQYFIEEVANPIRQHLINNNLLNKIRYIVLCQGVPFKIQAVGDYSSPGNISLDGLLCLLNTENYNEFLREIFEVYVNQCYPGCDPPACYSEPFISNPYYNKDLFFEMNHRFIPDNYTGRWNGYIYKLSYLVSRLDGLSFDIVKSIIDKSKTSDLTGNKTWIIDGGGPGSADYHETYYKLDRLGFKTEYNNNSSNWIINSQNSVIGYTSAGVHQGMPITYIQDILNFNYANGAIFNTYESYNGYCINTIRPRVQGLMTEFLLMGGTGGAGHGVWEPYAGAVKSNIYFPLYAVGYNQIDAAWQSMESLAWRSVFVGDPLTRIYNFEIKTLASDSTITNNSDFIGRLIVPAGKRLTIQSGVTLNLNRNSSLQINGILEVQQGAILNFNSYSSLVFNTGSSNQILQGVLNFSNKARLELNVEFYLSNSSNINFFDESHLNALTLIIGSGEFLTFSGNSKLIARELFLSAGTTLNFSDQCSLKIKKTLIALGTETNKVRININNTAYIDSATELVMQNVIFTGGKLEVVASNRVEMVNIHMHQVNITSNHNSILTINGGSAHAQCNAYISNVNITGNITSGINLVNLYNSEIRNAVINNITENRPNRYSVGISGINCYSFKVYDCTINKFEYGIAFNHEVLTKGAYENVYLLITGNEISNCINGIFTNRSMNGFAEILKNNIHMPLRSANEITTAIAVSNTNEVNIESNTVYDYDLGISLSLVNYPVVSDNEIQIINQCDNIQSGIFSNSGKGVYRLNFITGYKKGIELGNSFPLIGQNIITGNTETGIYIGPNSLPDLSSTKIKKEAAFREFPLSGFNLIYNNGGLCGDDFFLGSEIFVEKATVNLSYGCNTISDDRMPEPNLCNTRTLLIARGFNEDIKAEFNYWGNHPEFGHNPAGRIISDVNVNFEPFHTEPCVKYPDDKFLIIKSSSGDVVIDTIFSLGEATILDSLSEAYAVASKYFYDGEFSQAKQTYYSIVQNYGSLRKSLEAYTKLFTIAKLTNASSSEFTDLKNYYDSRLQTLEDTLMLKAVKHLSDLCLVAKKEYAQAINNFSEVITQNPNSAEAFFAAIDILTTSLLDTGNTILGKISGMDLSAKDANDFRTKFNLLLRTRNNNESILTSNVIPSQFSLHQNYPNPFNPTTKIQYDIPTDTKVQLIVYDILGCEVKTLVNGFQTAGSYTVDFNANNISSGVYIYQLSAKEFVKSRKMLVIK